MGARRGGVVELPLRVRSAAHGEEVVKAELMMVMFVTIVDEKWVESLHHVQERSKMSVGSNVALPAHARTAEP